MRIQLCSCSRAGGLTTFFEASDVPTTGTAPAATPAEALDIHRGAVALAFCHSCGLIINAAFDATAERMGLGIDAGPEVSSGLLPREREFTGSTGDAAVSVELPDALHTLREGAFWDLDCSRRSYVTPGSLARRVRAAGFELLDLRRTHRDSHFKLEARRSPIPTRMRFDLEDDLPAIAEATIGFAAAAHRQMSRWRRIIDNWLSDGKRVTVWGAVPKSVGFLSTLQVSDGEVARVVDPNVGRQGLFLAGTAQQIVPPQALRECPVDIVIIPDAMLQDEARRELDALGMRPQLLML